MARYRDYGGWPRYVPVAERRRKAERIAAKLRKQGQALAPVTIAGRNIATTFWGKAWCDNMEAYSDYESRLPRGRTYVRNGSVIDLQIARGQVTALVSGSEIYNITLNVKEIPATKWRSIRTDCAGTIESVVELLQGQLADGVMERLCRQDGGLFPKPSDIRFSCSCPDYAVMCKHVAAVLYGIGARLDEAPELLFRLRGVDESELVAQVDASLALTKQGPVADKVLSTDDVSALFGLDMAEPQAEPPPAETGDRKPPRARRPPAQRKAKPAAAAAAPAKPLPKPQAPPPEATPPEPAASTPGRAARKQKWLGRGAWRKNARRAPGRNR